MTYNELRGNIIAYEQNHIKGYNKNDKKKTLALTAETTDILEEVENIKAKLINKGVKLMLRTKTETSTGIQ